MAERLIIRAQQHFLQDTSSVLETIITVAKNRRHIMQEMLVAFSTAQLSMTMFTSPAPNT